MAEVQGTWIKNKKPTKEGQYLCAVRFSGRILYNLYRWSNNLHKIDKYDFPEKKKGWYDYSSEWGYREVLDVVAWMEFKPYEESAND